MVLQQKQIKKGEKNYLRLEVCNIGCEFQPVAYPQLLEYRPEEFKNFWVVYKSNQTTYVLRMKKRRIDLGVNRDMFLYYFNWQEQNFL